MKLRKRSKLDEYLPDFAPHMPKRLKSRKAHKASEAAENQRVAEFHAKWPQYFPKWSVNRK